LVVPILLQLSHELQRLDLDYPVDGWSAACRFAIVQFQPVTGGGVPALDRRVETRGDYSDRSAALDRRFLNDRFRSGRIHRNDVDIGRPGHDQDLCGPG